MSIKYQENEDQQQRNYYQSEDDMESYDNVSLCSVNALNGCYEETRNYFRANKIINNTSNGAATIAYMRQRKDSTKSTPSCNTDAESCFIKCSSKSLNMKRIRRKNSIGCLNGFYPSPESPSNCYGVTSVKSRSLPCNANGNVKDRFDATIFSVLRVPADELANQLTLLDLNTFVAIQPDELTSCAWTKKDKYTITPNIVAFTKRFNHTSFWTVQEILNANQAKQRAEIIVHFIKVAKKLHELHNLHSLFAVISALQSASIYRLKKTWSYVSRREKHCYDRLCDIFSEVNNWKNLRAYLESLRLPCIPYLGLFLTDLIYIDLAFPYKGGLESEQRRNRMNNILRVIANYQQSSYKSVKANKTIQNYLTSINYIEELQNIFESDQYKKSLKLEPLPAVADTNYVANQSKEGFNVDVVNRAMTCLNLSPAKFLGTLRISHAASIKSFNGHRKCQSLGTNIFGDNNDNACANRTFQHHLLDDSVLDNDVETSGNISRDADIGSNRKFINSKPIMCNIMEKTALSNLSFDPNGVQGYVKRKTLQKDGRKPAISAWQRYWLQIWSSSLVYFLPKSFKGNERTDFKQEPCKVRSLDGWCAQLNENSRGNNSFELHHYANGTTYKFRTDSPQAAQMWIHTICHVISSSNCLPSPHINLMSFE